MTTQEKIKETLKIFARDYKTFCECDVCHKEQEAILNRALTALTKIIEEEYKRGFIDGLTCYAWWGKDGQEVGTGGTKLKDAVVNVEKSWNYSPPTSHNGQK